MAAVLLAIGRHREAGRVSLRRRSPAQLLLLKRLLLQLLLLYLCLLQLLRLQLAVQVVLLLHLLRPRMRSRQARPLRALRHVNTPPPRRLPIPLAPQPLPKPEARARSSHRSCMHQRAVPMHIPVLKRAREVQGGGRRQGRCATAGAWRQARSRGKAGTWGATGGRP